MERQMELLNSISSRLTALEEARIEDEEEEEEDGLGKIGLILDHPVVQGLISAVLPAMINNGNKNNTQKPILNGVPNEEIFETMEGSTDTDIEDNFNDSDLLDIQEEGIKNITDSIKNSLERLSKHTDNLPDDLKALANMADNNPAQFKMILKMLPR
jgi:hypothetical protein